MNIKQTILTKNLQECVIISEEHTQPGNAGKSFILQFRNTKQKM